MRRVLILVVLALLPVIYASVATMLSPASVPHGASATQPGQGARRHAKVVTTRASTLRQVGHRQAARPATAIPFPLAAPVALRPFSSPGLVGEGQWRPAGRRVAGVPAVYETELRPPGSSVPAGVAWMDTRLLSARLYSGSDQSPGGGPWKYTAPIQPPDATSVVAAFNGGFKMPSAEGGYYTQGTWAVPPRPGAATLVIYADGATAIGAWGGGVRMAADVIAVRQNLHLLVDAGRPASDAGVVWDWGATVGGVTNTWRSGLGITRNNALVYVAGPGLDPMLLADLLIRAGAVRAMELDINPDWTVLATYHPPTGALAAPSNGTSLIQGMVQGPWTFFEAWWARDFVTMSARSPTRAA